MPAEKDAVFHCPRCHRPTGRQDKFTIHERDNVKVIVRCAECRHRWSVIMPAVDHANLPAPE